MKVPPSKVRKTSHRVRQSQIIGLSAAILLRYRNHSMNLVQRILSVLLYNGHVSKQVRLIDVAHARSILYIFTRSAAAEGHRA